MTTLALKIEGLKKSFGPVTALAGVDLEVRQGEVFGFLGPNGAGKTTTIRCLLDLIRPGAGHLRVLGLDPGVDSVAIRSRVGYLPSDWRLDDNLTGRQALRLLNSLRGRRAAERDIHRLAERLDIDLERPVRQLSRGNRQKIGIVQAFMHRPELLLLDEPTGGLDPFMQQEVQGLIAEARTEGTTVFLSSHILSEVEAVADRVAMIRHGRVVEVAPTASLIERAIHRAMIRFKQPVDAALLAAVPGVSVLSREDDGALHLQVDGDMDQLIKALSRYPVAEFITEIPSLEEVFREYYEGDGHAVE